MTPKASPNDLLPTNQPVNPMQGFITGVTQGIQGLVGGNNQKIISPLSGSDFLNTPGLLDYARRESDASVPQSPTNGMPIAAKQPQPNPIQQAITQFIPSKSQQVFTQMLDPQKAQAAPEAITDPEKQAVSIFDKWQIPPQVGFGMMNAEGGKIGQNNPYNINATDSNPQGANNYQSSQQGIEAFAKLIATHPRYAKAYALRNEPEKMLTEIQNAGYAGDPNDWYNRKLQETPNFPYKTYKDFVMDTPGYKRFAD